MRVNEERFNRAMGFPEDFLQAWFLCVDLKYLSKQAWLSEVLS